MAKRTQVTIAPEFLALTRNLPKRLRQRVYDDAVKAGGNIIKEEALTRLRGVDDKARRSDIVVQKYRARTRATGELAAYRIGVNAKRWYLAFKEYGRQELFAKGRAIPMHLEDGSVVFTKHAKAVPARPFWRPAVAASTEKAHAKIDEEVGKGIRKQAAALVSPFGKVFR